MSEYTKNRNECMNKSITHRDVDRYNSVVCVHDRFLCSKIECHSPYNIDRLDEFVLVAVAVMVVAIVSKR